MSNKFLNTLAKFMIFFALILISCGVYLNLHEGSILDPVKDIIKVENDNLVIITTNNGQPPATTKDDTDSNNSNGVENSVPIDSITTNNNAGTNNTNTNTNSNSGSNNTGSNATNSGNAGSSTVPATPPSTTPTKPDVTVTDTNFNYKKNIEDTYGIKVFYGTDTVGYTVGSMSTNPLTDDANIKSALDQLNAALAVYPNGFFREFLKQNMNLNVYLIKNYSADNVTGVTDFSLRKVNISIAMDFPFNDSFHHEVLHYIEHYIDKSGGNFNSWNSFNPNGFVYGSENNDYSYNKTGLANSYFVNNYAQSSASEDRASTFEYMTANSRYSCFDSHDYPIWKKSDYISNIIDTYFETVTPRVIDYWERYIY